MSRNLATLVCLAATAAFALVCFSTDACANLLVNGSFETGPDWTIQWYCPLFAGDTRLQGWTVTGQGVDRADFPGWVMADGTRCVDLNHLGPGGVNQSFGTELGQTYRVAFDLAGNEDGGPTIKTVRVRAGSRILTYDFDITGRTDYALGWVEVQFYFVADSQSTNLAFDSLVDGPYGPLIDNVRVEAVPEPSTIFALLYGVGALVWRKQKGAR